MGKKIIAIILAAAFFCGVLPFVVFAEGGEVNLALGLEYTVETGEPISKTYGDLIAEGLEINRDTGALTDSKTAQPLKSSELWFRAYSGKSRIITFDLGEISSVSGIEAGFLEDRANEIFAPRYIKIHLSADGENYETVKEYNREYAVSTDDKSARRSVKIPLDSNYAVRYVRVEYSCEGFTYCDEIRVKGKKELAGNEKKPRVTVSNSSGGYTGDINKYRDIVKLYNGFWGKDPSVGVLTETELLPYVAYINKNGEIAGKMFDSAILLPCNGVYPSGGRLYKTDDAPAVMSDYQLYLEHTFTAGQDLSALNKVVAKVNSALDTNDKFGVLLSVPYPSLTDIPFGDINGDGNVDYCATLEDRLAIIKWYVEECITQFRINDYKNLELCGFCWLEDEVDFYYSDHEEQLLIQANQYINGKGYKTLCSFGYLSAGFHQWKDLGFSVAVMKGELSPKGFSPEMLPEYSRSIYNNRMSAEIETGALLDYLQGEEDYLTAGHNYESYMFYGRKYGYSAALNIYEQDMAPGTLYEFCYADKSTPKGNYLRRLYDLTYNHINNSYINMPPTVEVETEAEILFGDTQINFDFEIKDIDSYDENVTIEFPIRPEHGKVVAAASKNKLIYSVDNGFVGTDTFTVCVNDGFNRTEPIMISVTVTKPQDSDETMRPSVSAEPLPLGMNSDVPTWLLVVLIGLALAMVGVAITVIVKPDKQQTDR